MAGARGEAITVDLERDGEGAVTVSDVGFTWASRVPFRIDIDAFRVKRGERLLLLGPSGSGKSTLLSLLAGIVAPHKGALRVLGTDLAALSSAERDRFRAEHFGIVFQMFNLLPYGSIVDNVILPLHFAAKRRARAAAEGPLPQVAARLMSALGVEPSLLDGAAAADLSVGQQQRVAAARALIGSPEIIVADEPTSALDSDAQAAFLKLLFAEVARAGASLIMVSHDRSLAPLFDRAVAIGDIARVGRGSNA